MIAHLIEQNNWGKKQASKEISEVYHSLKIIFDYKSFRQYEGLGLWYATQLNIKACPYCNAQYTIVARESDKKTLANFQFDHFYSQSRFPFFALSMYNLIPCCSTCNLRKSRKNFSIGSTYHPYDNEIDYFSVFKLQYPDDIYKMNVAEIAQLDESELKINLESKFGQQQFVEDHKNVFKVDELYSRHIDIGLELLVKTKMYNGAGIEYLNNIQGLFPDRETALLYILGNYTNREKILDRPLAKMTRDLAIQFGFISEK